MIRGAGICRTILAAFGVILVADCKEVTLPYSCSFETNLCGMKLGPVNWRRIQGESKLPSKAAHGAWFIRAAASWYIITTPNLMHQGLICVRFMYAIAGSTMLRVSSLKAKSNKEELLQTYLATDKSWHSASLAVKKFPRGGQVKWSALPNKYNLDAILIVSGDCAVALPYKCSFERSLCGMYHPLDSSDEWTRSQGGREVSSILPTTAANGDWFIKTYNVTKQVRIVTPELMHQGSVCVRFNYYATDGSIHWLKVHKFHQHTKSFEIWSIFERADGEWHPVSHTIDFFPFGSQVILEEEDRIQTSGSGFGLDDIRITAGACKGCAVDNGGCDHVCRDTRSGPLCSCRPGYERVESSCKGCVEDYRFISSSPESPACSIVHKIYGKDQIWCLKTACDDVTVNTVSYRDTECVLMSCQTGEYRLTSSTSSPVWDIYIRNETFANVTFINATISDVTLAGGKSYTMWQILIVTAVVVISMAAIIGVTLIIAPRRQPLSVSGESDTRPEGGSRDDVTGQALSPCVTWSASPGYQPGHDERQTGLRVSPIYHTIPDAGDDMRMEDAYLTTDVAASPSDARGHNERPAESRVHVIDHTIPDAGNDMSTEDVYITPDMTASCSDECLAGSPVSVICHTLPDPDEDLSMENIYLTPVGGGAALYQNAVSIVSMMTGEQCE